MYFVEFSGSQMCFHVGPVDVSIADNLRAFQKGTCLDFVPVGMFDTAEEAYAFCDALKDVRQRPGKHISECGHDEGKEDDQLSQLNESIGDLCVSADYLRDDLKVLTATMAVLTDAINRREAEWN